MRPLEWDPVAGYAVVKGLPRVFPPLAYSGQPHARRQVPDAVAGYPKVQGVGGEGVGGGGARRALSSTQKKAAGHRGATDGRGAALHTCGAQVPGRASASVIGPKRKRRWAEGGKARYKASTQLLDKPPTIRQDAND